MNQLCEEIVLVFAKLSLTSAYAQLLLQLGSIWMITENKVRKYLSMYE